MKRLRFPSCAYFIGSGFLLLLFLIAPTAYSQQICDPANPNNGACQQNGFPECYECALVGQVPQCVPDDTFCDDGNACTEDICVTPVTPVIPPIFPNGCTNLSLALAEDPALPIECYVCEPSENGVVVNNGICDRAAGENCGTDLEDCGVPGENCVFPSPVPTPSPGCDNAGATPEPWGPCEDGDRCTANLCNVDPQTSLFVCSNPELACNPTADGCCPDGCVGPDIGTVCPVTTGPSSCDPDCCPNEDCGDGMVEPVETCDDAADAGLSGVAPDGSSVTDEECRDSGAANQCTYCGDGIIDSPTEECDGTELGDCTTCSGNCLCGIIPPPPATGLRIFGSGILSCSLNKGAQLPTEYGWLWLAMLVAVTGAGLILKRRAR